MEHVLARGPHHHNLTLQQRLVQSDWFLVCICIQWLQANRAVFHLLRRNSFVLEVVVVVAWDHASRDEETRPQLMLQEQNCNLHQEQTRPNRAESY